MEIKEQRKLRFKGVDFPFVELSSTQPFKESEDNKVSVEITPKAFIPDDQKSMFKIVMSVTLFVENYFRLSITGVGTFQISGDEENITDEERDGFINLNSTAIMFPYLRSFISTLTSNLGNVTTPIILPTRFFKGELERVSAL
jgi:preprotein translocase subunit SecB